MPKKLDKRLKPIDVEIGGRVRFLRLRLDMSQEKLADLLGLTFQQVQKYEKGTNRISGSRLTDIAKILRVPVAALFGEDGKGAPIAMDSRLNTRVRQHLVSLLDDIGDVVFETALRDFVLVVGNLQKK